MAMGQTKRPMLWVLLLLLVSTIESLAQEEGKMQRPLTVHPANPRYFADGSGKAIYLTGTHTWNNLQHNGVYPAVDYDEYLSFLRQHNHNFIRMWAWE